MLRAGALLDAVVVVVTTGVVSVLVRILWPVVLG
jgi:sodium-dependent dicarboxylate transporter 2/3/5